MLTAGAPPPIFVARRTPDQAQEVLAQMAPEQKQQMQAMQQRMQDGMHDMKHLAEQFKPDAADPDAPVSLLRVIRALASAPLLAKLPTEEGDAADAESAVAECTDEVLSKLEAAFVAAGAFDAGALAECAALERRNVLLLFWHMYQSHLPELASSLTGGVVSLTSFLNSQATKLLVRAQMLMPQQRWVQPTLAIAHASALLSTALWSHTDEKALEAMRVILKEDALPFPNLTLRASAGPQSTAGIGDECAAGQKVLVRATVTRLHKSVLAEGEVPPPPNNPQGIYEAYWVYIEGLKPQGTPNSLVCAQPLVVKDVSASEVSVEQPFVAPPTPGTYTLRVHLVSTSVVGIALTHDVSFVVVEDDVPALE